MTPKPSVWIEPVRNRARRVTSWRVCWRVPGLGRGALNTGPIKEHAAQKARELERQAWEGKLQLRARQGEHTWAQLVERFKGDHAGNVSPRTWEVYEYAIREFDAELGRDFPIALFDLDQAAKLKARLTGARKLKPNSVSIVLRHVRAVLNHAVRPLKWISDHGLLDLEIPRYQRGGVIIQADWLHDLVEHAPARAKAPTWLLPHTGMRSGELINLQHPQLDRTHSYVRVMRHGAMGVESGWERKTRNEVHVPIAPELWPHFGPQAAAGWVFPGYNQRDPRQRTVQLALDWRRALIDANRARAAAGKPPIPRLTPHHCKHTFATMFLEAGGSIQRLSDITGTRAETLLRTYRHIISRAPVSETSRVSFGRSPIQAPIPAPALPQQEAPRRRAPGARGARSRRKK
jgi:integrase